MSPRDQGTQRPEREISDPRPRGHRQTDRWVCMHAPTHAGAEDPFQVEAEAGTGTAAPHLTPMAVLDRQAQKAATLEPASIQGSKQRSRASVFGAAWRCVQRACRLCAWRRPACSLRQCAHGLGRSPLASLSVLSPHGERLRYSRVVLGRTNATQDNSSDIPKVTNIIGLSTIFMS